MKFRLKKIHITESVLTRAAVISLILAAALGVVVWMLPELFRMGAEREVKSLVMEAGLDSFSYSGRETCNSELDFAEEVFRLAAWEGEEKERIRSILGGKSMPGRYGKGLFILPSMEHYRWLAKQFESVEAEEKLEDAVRDAIHNLYVRTSGKTPFTEVKLLASYQQGGFDVIRSEAALLSEKDSQSLKESALFSKVSEPVFRSDPIECIPVDLLYIYRGDELLRSGTAFLEEKQAKKDLDVLDAALQRASAFESRFQTVIPDHEKAEAVYISMKEEKEEKDRKAAAIAYAKKPDIPAVDMRYHEALSTKLGSPTRSNIKYKQDRLNEYAYGDLYWDANGRQIFYARIQDDRVTRVQDSRKRSSSSGNYSYSYSIKSSSSRKNDPYDVYHFDDPDDFADEWAAEFGDGNWDDGWDDAWDYWQDTH